MDIKEYISSGVLELYVAGVLSPEEMKEVRAMSLKYPEIAAEIEKIEEVMIGYLETDVKAVNPNIKTKILEGLANEPVAEKRVVPEINHQPTIVRTITTRPSDFARYAVAAMILVSLSANIIFYMKWKDAEENLSGMIAQNYQLAQNYQQVKGSYEKMNEEFRHMSAPQNIPVKLKGLPLSPQSTALVIWNPETRETYMAAANLPVPEPDHQYQLWAIVDGKPVDAGVFEVGDTTDGMQKLKNIEHASAFAVTLEKKGGSPVPTMDKMYLMAKI